MKTALCIIILVAAAVVLTSAMPAKAIDYTFDVTAGNWGTAANWSPGGGPPGSDDKATIPAGKTCLVSAADQEVEVLDLSGLLRICGTRTLTLYDSSTEDSIVNGKLVFGCIGNETCIEGDATLEIAETTTIKGDGGEVFAACDTGYITGTASIRPPVLTLEDSGPGELTVNARGATVDVEVKLVNNAHVGGYTDGSVLTLSDQQKSGCGEWFATAQGKLDVSAVVKGDGTWYIEPNSEIEINTSPEKLTGDVDMYSGLLDVNVDFCTTGDLDMFVQDGTGVITVADGASAMFAGACK